MTETSSVAKEIERKFLLRFANQDEWAKFVATVPWEHQFFINHGWLPGEVILERISFSGKYNKFWRVIKTGSGLERIEAQEEISREFWEKLWALTDRHVCKVRLQIPTPDGLLWEIDNFVDREPAVYMAEVEIPTQDTKVSIPDWLAPFIVREVTEDPAYVNYNMAHKGEPKPPNWVVEKWKREASEAR